MQCHAILGSQGGFLGEPSWLLASTVSPIGGEGPSSCLEEGRDRTQLVTGGLVRGYTLGKAGAVHS